MYGTCLLPHKGFEMSNTSSLRLIHTGTRISGRPDMTTPVYRGHKATVLIFMAGFRFRLLQSLYFEYFLPINSTTGWTG